MSEIIKEDLGHILEHTADLWEEVRNNRIFITGGTGFFGCWLLESFLHANSELKLNASTYVLTRDPDAFRNKAPHLFDNPGLVMVKGDVCSFTFPEGKFSHIIHAAKVTENESGIPDPISIFDRIVRGTQYVLEFARHCSAKKMLFTSSGAVYGKQPTDLLHVPEEYTGAPDPANESAAYGEAKRVSEFLCAMYSRYFGFEAKVARCFAFVGPYFPIDSKFAINDFIGNVLRRQSIYIKGDGTPYRSYLYAADLTIWLWTILFKGISSRPYNVGSEEEISIADLANKIAIASGQNLGIITSKPLPSAHPERYVPSTERARHELGLRQYISLEDAIRRTMEWYSNRVIY